MRGHGFDHHAAPDRARDRPREHASPRVRRRHRRGPSGAGRRATSWSPSTGLAAPGRPADRSGCGRGRSAKGHSTILVEKRPALHEVPAARPGPRPTSHRKKWSRHSMPPSGKTIWEHRYPSPTAGIDYTRGRGTARDAAHRRQSTLRGGIAPRVHRARQDHRQGAVVARSDQGVRRPEIDRGMANSPLLYNNMILLPIGGRGQAIGAFNPETGALLWKAGNVEYSPASPIMIDVDGQQQLVLFGGDRIAGIDPANGRELWSIRIGPTGASTSAPRCGRPSDHLLLFSSAYGTGSRALELRQAGGKTTVAERWAVNRVRVHIGSIIRIGDTAYMSSGDFGPAFLTAVEYQDRRHRVAGPRLRARAAALRRRQADRARRRRHARRSPPCRRRASRCWRGRRSSRTSRGRRRRWSARRSTSAIARPSPPTTSADSSWKPQ